MRRANKIYADQDPNFEGKKSKLFSFVFHPRWWNPFFWVFILFYIVVFAVSGAACAINELIQFFKQYKV